MIRIKLVDIDDILRNYFIDILHNDGIEFNESENPDFVIYSIKGHEHIKFDCVRIFVSDQGIQPDFNVCDYAIGDSDIEFEDRFLHVNSPVSYGQGLQREISNFLRGIFECKSEEVMRRCNQCWGLMLQNDMKEIYTISEINKSPKIMDRIVSKIIDKY